MKSTTNALAIVAVGPGMAALASVIKPSLVSKDAVLFSVAFTADNAGMNMMKIKR